MKNSKFNYKTISEVRSAFWQSFPEFKSEYRKTWRQNRYRTDIRVTFCDFAEHLRRNGDISENLANRVTL